MGVRFSSNCSLNFSLLEIFKVVCLLFNYQGSILRHFSTSKIIARGLVTNFQRLSVLLFCVVLCLKRQLLKGIIHQVSLSTLFCICFKSFSYQRSDHFSVFPPSLVSDLIRISSRPVFVNMFFRNSTKFDQTLTKLFWYRQPDLEKHTFCPSTMILEYKQ